MVQQFEEKLKGLYQFLKVTLASLAVHILFMDSNPMNCITIHAYSLERIAIKLFSEKGYNEVNVNMIDCMLTWEVIFLPPPDAS